jgi:hypothetical protein
MVPWGTVRRILFTDEQPMVPVYAGYRPPETRRALKRKEEPGYQGIFTGARKYVLQTYAKIQSAMMKRRVAQSLSSSDYPVCKESGSSRRLCRLSALACLSPSCRGCR